MEFKLLSDKEIMQLLAERLPGDFAPDEIKPAALIQQRIDEGRYFARGLFEDGQLLAYAFFFREGDAMLLDYFAVDGTLRGRGVGSAALREMELMPEAAVSRLYLEVEDPAFAPDEADRLHRERRIAFYERAGYVGLGIKTRITTSDYIIMGKPGVSADTAREAVRRLYSVLFPPEFLPGNVEIKN